MKYIEEINVKDATREEWLELRKKGIGGSDAGAILGLSKWKTPFEVYMEKVDPVDSEPPSEAAYWGTVLEDVVAIEFEKRTGKKVRRNNRTMFSKDFPFMLANIDREIVGENALLECKTASAYTVDQWEGDRIPDSYIIQGQHYLAVTGKEKIYYAALIGGQKFIWKEVDRDEELIRYIRESESKFWFEHVVPKVPPALDGSSAAEKWVNERFKKAEEKKTVELNSEIGELVKNLEQLKNEINTLEEGVKKYENQIKLVMEDAEIGYTLEHEISWKNCSRKTIDGEALRKDHPDIAEKYEKKSTFRTFKIKKIKGEK